MHEKLLGIKSAVLFGEIVQMRDYLILCSILIHPSCLNRGSDGAMGS
jgi:hypothetical protein